MATNEAAALVAIPVTKHGRFQKRPEARAKSRGVSANSEGFESMDEDPIQVSPSSQELAAVADEAVARIQAAAMPGRQRRSIRADSRTLGRLLAGGGESPPASEG